MMNVTIVAGARPNFMKIAPIIHEIPQLINVLKGDMSLFGTRRLLPEYLSLCNQEQKKRLIIKPGVTGWSHVNGRNTIGWEEKFKLDIRYVDNFPLLLVVKIIFLTKKKVFVSEGVSTLGQATTEVFKGN